MRDDPVVTAPAPSRRTAALDSACRRQLEGPSGAGGDHVLAGLSRRRAAAILLVSTPVHLAAPAAVVAAVWVLGSDGGPLSFLLVIALVLLAMASWPPRTKRDDPVATLTPQEAPATFELLGRVGDHVGAPRLHRLELTPGLDSGVRRSGLLRRPVMTVGAVGWAPLSAQGRVALVAHEAAHLVRPELRLARLTARAEAILEEWRMITGGEPPRRGAEAEDARRFVTAMSAVMLAPVRALVVLWTRSLLRLQVPVTARGELLADRIAAQAAGPDALHEVWDAALSAQTWETALTRGLSGREDLVTTLRTAVAAVPPERTAKRRESSAESGHRVDADHPATHLRRLALGTVPAGAVPAGAAPVVIEASLALASDAELGTELARALRDAAHALRYTAPGSALGQHSADAVRRHVRARNEFDTAGS